jgi:membrane-bound serine protease (ClpP class)
MRRTAPFLLFSALMCMVAGSAGAQDTPSVLVAKVDGSIDRTLASYLVDSIEEAEREGSTLVLQLDSAGTLDQDAVALAERIHDASVPVIVWVGPAPAKAEGAALLFLYAASLGAVAPGAGVGPLEPLDLAGDEPAIPQREVEALATGWVQERRRATPPMFPDRPVPARAALDGHVASVAAVSITDLLDQADGHTVGTADGEVTLETKIATSEAEQRVTVRFTELGPLDRVLHAAASPTWIYVLLVLGLAALAFEATQPGFGFAGFAGLGMLALAVYGLTVVPFSPLGLGLLLAGIGLLTLDVRLRTLGPLSFAGMLAFIAGRCWSSGASPGDRRLPVAHRSVLGRRVPYWGFGLTVAVQSRDRLTSTQRGLVGLVGEARGELRPDGPVFVKGALWRGRSSDGPIPAGSRIRVRGVDGLILRVQQEPSPPRAPICRTRPSHRPWSAWPGRLVAFVCCDSLRIHRAEQQAESLGRSVTKDLSKASQTGERSGGGAHSRRLDLGLAVRRSVQGRGFVPVLRAQLLREA